MLRTLFWKHSAEQLQTSIKQALDRFADDIKYARSCNSRGLEESALNSLISTIRQLGFTGADALRWGRARKCKP